MDYFVFGYAYFGTCDRVPGHIYLVTYFFHVAYIPLVPLNSFIVTSWRDEQLFGKEIPISKKSVVLAWSRMLSFFITFFAAIYTVGAWNSGTRLEAIVATAITAAAFITYLLLMILPRRPTSYKRACELGLHAEICPEAWEILHTYYGRPASLGVPQNPYTFKS
jgi:hypothetical protein